MDHIYIYKYMYGGSLIISSMGCVYMYYTLPIHVLVKAPNIYTYMYNEMPH